MPGQQGRRTGYDKGTDRRRRAADRTRGQTADLPLFGRVSGGRDRINGRAALERLGRREVDVVFTDIRMPSWTASSCGKHPERLSEVVTVLLSGYQEFEYAQKAVRFQAFDYLLKPVSFEKMSALLGKLEILCRNRAYLKKRDQLSGLIEGNGEASAAQADCVTLLVNAGAMPLTSDDLGAPGRKFWRGVQLEELLRSIVPERDSVLPFSGKSKTERIVVIETRSPDSARAAIETLPPADGNDAAADHRRGACGTGADLRGGADNQRPAHPALPGDPAVRLPASVGRAGRRQASGEGDPPFELPGQPGGGGDLRGQRGAAFRRGRRNARRVRA
ncbi:MAG: response regulator [Anaerotruncus massiliensis (ex Togo et al. 2019)]